MRPENATYAVFGLVTWAVALTRGVEVAALAFLYLIVVGLGLFLMRHGRPEREVMLYQLAFNMALGPLGAVAGAVVVLARALRPRKDGAALQAWYRDLSGRADAKPLRDIARDIETGRLRPEATITPKSAQELLVNGTQREKRDVLTWIARRRDPLLRPLLEIAVRGKDPTIRSQAASILFRLRGS